MKEEKRKLKHVLITGSVISIVFYILFTLVVVGFMGVNTPEVATLALGGFFVFLGMFTMFTSHFSLGNALEEVFQYDDKIRKIGSWFYATIVPILIYVIISFTNFFSFTKILSIGGVVSGGAIAILILFMVRKAKSKGERNPEYSIPLNRIIIYGLTLVFVLGVIRELIAAVRNF